MRREIERGQTVESGAIETVARRRRVVVDRSEHRLPVYRQLAQTRKAWIHHEAFGGKSPSSVLWTLRCGGTSPTPVAAYHIILLGAVR